jgi:hypothetical protein
MITTPRLAPTQRNGQTSRTQGTTYSKPKPKPVTQIGQPDPRHSRDSSGLDRQTHVDHSNRGDVGRRESPREGTPCYVNIDLVPT